MFIPVVYCIHSTPDHITDFQLTLKKNILKSVFNQMIVEVFISLGSFIKSYKTWLVQH